MEEKHINVLKALYLEWTGNEASTIEFLPLSGSDRKYYRIQGHEKNAIGTFNADIKENEAFFSFARSMKQCNLPVPSILAISNDKTCYLQDDLGNTTLFKYLTDKRSKGIFPKSVIETYKQILEYLPTIQVTCANKIDFSKCYPRSAFDRQSMMWDLNYFKYYFLKLARIPFDEQLLENDYKSFCDYLLSASSDFFLYRDFQSRNIMVENDQVFFIDFQGGRKGALQYDVASLLYDAKANIPEEIREELLEFYLDELEKVMDIDRNAFKNMFYAFVLIRIMQAMGAYGFRGFYERKTHFLQSIPYALKNLGHVLQKANLPDMLHLTKLLKQLPQAPSLKKYTQYFQVQHPLIVTIQSFSYKKGLPEDHNGNGGGYIFDCRCMHNPGRYEEYMNYTGRDQPVIEFLKKEGEIDFFMSNVIQLVEQSIDKYLDRGFANLQVNFGCTGGQHRSVYCAEQLSHHLKDHYNEKVKIVLNHREQNIFTEL